MEPQDTPTPLIRWERMCSRFETLIEGWLDATEVSADKRDWAQSLASVSMAAQRIAGLRTLLMTWNAKETNGHGDDETVDPAERQHWQALAHQLPEADAPEG